MPRLGSFGLKSHIILDRRMDYSAASSGFLAMEWLRVEDVGRLKFIIVYKMMDVGILCFRRYLNALQSYP